MSLLITCGFALTIILAFPTRRSSDLFITHPPRVGAVPPAPGPASGPSFVRAAKPAAAPGPHPASASGSGSGSDPRSEEHTSELQSRENLVCRLLLEKKTTSLTLK